MFNNWLDHYLMPQEKVIYRAECHWIVFLTPAVFLLVSIFFLSWAPVLRKLAIIPLLVVVITGFHQTIAYLFTEMSVTERRLLAKMGYIRRTYLEIPLENIASFEVKRSLLGSVLGYGRLSIFDTGHQTISLDPLSDPIELRRHIQIALDHLKSIESASSLTKEG
jgi:uncharacterized membrane protein YdbT with pleckstrin-like domain